MTFPVRVGIIGLSAGRGWAALAHVPAIRAVDGVVLAGGCASSPESSARAAHAFGLRRAYATPEDLVTADDIDLVTVTVKVSRHHALVSAALKAGKAVLCEWPLGNGLAEAEDLARQAAERRLPAFVGLQVMSAPFIAHLADVVATGEIGEVLSTSILASGSAWGATLTPDQAYLMDPAEGASMLTIPMGHTLAGVQAVLGSVASVQAVTAVRRPTALEVGTGTVYQRRTPDQTALTLTLESGATGVVHYRGGMSKATNFHWEINGTRGDIVVSAPNGHLQMAAAQVAIAGPGDKSLRPLPTPPRYASVPGVPATSPAYNVAHAYERLVRALRDGTRTLPDFADGARHHRLLAAIEQAAATGERTSVHATPEPP